MGQEPSESVTPDTKATLLGSLSIPIWSFTPVFIVLLPVVSPFLLMGFRFLISGCILSLIGLSRGVSLRQQLTHHRGVWALSVTGILISQIIYVFSLQYAPTASANFINYLWPLYLIFLTGFYDQQKMQLRYWFSAILGFMGCAIIIGGGDHFQGFQLQHVIGYQLAAVAGLMWAFYSFFMRRHFVREQNSVQGGPFLLFAAICFAIYFAGSPSSVPVLSIEQVDENISSARLAYFSSALFLWHMVFGSMGSNMAISVC